MAKIQSYFYVSYFLFSLSITLLYFFFLTSAVTDNEGGTTSCKSLIPVNQKEKFPQSLGKIKRKSIKISHWFSFQNSKFAYEFESSHGLGVIQQNGNQNASSSSGDGSAPLTYV